MAFAFYFLYLTITQVAICKNCHFHLVYFSNYAIINKDAILE